MGDLAVYVGLPMRTRWRNWLGSATKRPITDTEAHGGTGSADKLDGFHANCTECEGLEQPEACVDCFPLAEDAAEKTCRSQSAQESQR